MQYDQPTSSQDVADNLAARVTDGSLSSATRDAIAAILGLSAGGDVTVAQQDGYTYSAPPGESPDLAVFEPVNEAGGEPAQAGDDVTVYPLLDTTANASAYIFSTDANVTAAFSPIDSVIVSGNGNDNLTIEGDANVTVDGGDGNDTIATANGADSVIGGAGDDSISTGEGNDTILAGEGADTIDGGEGFDTVQLQGAIEDYQVAIVGGQLVLTSNDDPSISVTATNVEFIQLETGSITVAANEDEAQALRLYQTVFDRSGDAGGAEFWLDQVDEGVSLLDIANVFLGSEEADAQGYNDMSDALFVNTLYENAFDRGADPDGLVYWTNAITSGEASRAEVIVQFVSAAEAEGAIDNVIILDGLV